MSASKLLSICIPTFNRSVYLDACLKRVFVETQGQEHLVNVLVSDNASTDDTQAVVAKYQNMGLDIKYNKHSENLGTEKNFLSLYEKAETKYFWLLSDDDYVVPGVLKNILPLLQNDDYGVIYLNNMWYDEIPAVIEPVADFKTVAYDDKIDFLKRVTYWITFISGNIINKSVLLGKVKPDEYNGTMLNYLGWYIPAIFDGGKNAVVENICLICKANNSGGYKLFKVFSNNFNEIIDSLIRKGYPDEMKSIINNSLIKRFFPGFMPNRLESFEKENIFNVLFKTFWRYKSFWTVLFPMFVKHRILLPIVKK